MIVAALDATYQRKPFGRILELIPLAEKVCKLNSICVKCGAHASFTKRTSDSSAVELIGGSELYIPLCRGCFRTADAEGLHGKVNGNNNDNDAKVGEERKAEETAEIGR